MNRSFAPGGRGCAGISLQLSEAAILPQSAQRRRHIYIASLALILGGSLALVASPIVQLVDTLTARSRRVETAAWAQRYARAPAGTASARLRQNAPIAPQREGYLLEIPKIGLRMVVRELEAHVFSGENTPLLKRYGLGQVPYTDYLRNVSPGGEGIAAIVGHRTTSGAPFRHIDRLRSGDRIIVQKLGVTQEWEVVHSMTVPPTAVEAIRSRPGSRSLVIVACDPPFSDAERLVVYAKLKRIVAID